MIDKTISHYHFLERLSGGVWLWEYKKNLNPSCSLCDVVDLFQTYYQPVD